MPVQDFMAGDDVKEAWDFLDDPVDDASDALVEVSDDVADNDDIADEEDPDGNAETSPAPDFDVDELVSAVQHRDQLLAQQGQQLEHLTRRLNAPTAKPYDKLDPNDPVDAKHILECEEEAAIFDIDPAYVHRDKVKQYWVGEQQAMKNCVAAVGAYVDAHPDAAELGDVLAKKISTDPAWASQLRITSMLSPAEMEIAAKAAIDGMYARLKLETSGKRTKAEVQAAQLQAQRQAENNERAKRRGRGERSGVTPGKSSPKPSATRDDDSFDGVLAARQGGFWGAFRD